MIVRPFWRSCVSRYEVQNQSDKEPNNGDIQHEDQRRCNRRAASGCAERRAEGRVHPRRRSCGGVLWDDWQRRGLLRRASRDHDGCGECAGCREADGRAERSPEQLLWFVHEQLLRLSGLGSEAP